MSPVPPANSKLHNFCKVVRVLEFRWAWSDICCVNQLDKGVQQESLVAMFKWYRGSSLTIVHLLGVISDSQEIGCRKEHLEHAWKGLMLIHPWISPLLEEFSCSIAQIDLATRALRLVVRLRQPFWCPVACTGRTRAMQTCR
ncbi:hypothetical protein EV363DRAFT_1139338, partial [Boletus edulis]